MAGHDAMNWNDLADDAAVRHHTFESMTGEDNERIRYGFWNGAKWQRDQLRTNKAIERVADVLFAELEGCTILKHEIECPRLDCGYRDEYTHRARAAITALLGEES